MVEEALPTIWASMHSWFTPTVFFVLLNLVIGTIAVSSRGIRAQPQKDDDQNPDDHRTLSRSSSVMDRLRSISLNRYRSGEIPPDTFTNSETLYNSEDLPMIPRAPSLMDRLRSISLSHHRSGEIQPDTSTNSETLNNPEDLPNLSRAPSVLERIPFIGLYRYRSGEIPLETATNSETLESSPDPTEDHHYSRSQSDTHPTAVEAPEKLAGKIKKSAFGHLESEVVRRPASARTRARVGEEEEVDARADDFINRFRQQLKLQRVDSILRYTDMLNRGKQINKKNRSFFLS